MNSCRRPIIRYFLFLFCFLPCLAAAQSWNVIAAGGGVWNSKSSRPTSSEHASPIGGTCALGLSYLWANGWETGLRIEYQRYGFTHEGTYVFEEDFDPMTGLTTTSSQYYKFVSAMPAWAIAPFVNRHFGKGRMDYYAGLSPAYLRFIGPKVSDSSGNSVRLAGAKGFGVDIHTGAAFRVTRGFSLFAEGAGGIVNMPRFTERAYVYTASLMLGIKVRIE